MDFSLFTRESDFHPWSSNHGVPVLIFLLLTVLICVYAKRKLSRPQQKKILLIASIIPLISVFVYMAIEIATGQFSIQEDLPLHICRVVALLAPWIYWKEKPLWTGISYFWVMVGTTNAVITPDVYVNFPHWEYLCYFILHLGLIFLPIYYCVVMGHRPQHKDFWRAVIASNFFLLFSLMVNKILESNYMFTSHKPEVASLLDYLGPWPIYIFSVELIGIVFFYIVLLPFIFIKLKERESPRSPS